MIANPIEARTRLSLLPPREKPDPKQLIEELRVAMRQSQGLGLYNRLLRCHETFNCIWPGQSDDGRKPGEDAKPWKGAIDSRVRTARKLVHDTVRLQMRAIRSGQINIGPEELNDEEKAQTWDAVLRFYRQRCQRQLNDALKLFFTCEQEFGYAILQVGWRDFQALVPKKIHREDLLQHLYALNRQSLVEQLPPEAGGVLPPEVEADLTQQVAITLEEMLMDDLNPGPLIELLRAMDPDMPESEAKLTARQLRKDEDQDATYYAPKSTGGRPYVQALVPLVNCLHGMDLTSTDVKTWLAVPERLSAVELRERAARHEWDVDIDELLKYANIGMIELEALSAATGGEWLMNGIGVGMKLDKQQEVPWYEVVTIYRVACNEAGLPAVYETEVYPAMPEVILSHKAQPIVREDGSPCMPFVVKQREPGLLAVQSQGIPDDVLTDQLGMKKIWDGTVAAAELAAYPPSQRLPGDEEVIMPGTTLSVNPRQTGTQGAQSRFLEVPGVNLGALKALEMMHAEVAERYHRGADADPDLRNAYEEDLGTEAVLAYTEVMRLIWAHVQAYVPEIVASRIAGKPVNLQASREDLQGTADISVDFSAVALNQERAKEQNEFVKMLLAYGSSRVDVDAAVEQVARTFDVNLAQRIILPVEEGAASAVKDERQAITEMQSGQEVRGRMNSPQARLSAYAEWMRNPNSIDLCLTVPGFYELVLLRMQGLEMQVEQFTTNVVTGQTGQKPPAWQEQQKLSEQLMQMVQQRRGMMMGGMSA